MQLLMNVYSCDIAVIGSVAEGSLYDDALCFDPAEDDLLDTEMEEMYP
jgi:hypothetical protein